MHFSIGYIPLARKGPTRVQSLFIKNIPGNEGNIPGIACK